MKIAQELANDFYVTANLGDWQAVNLLKSANAFRGALRMVAKNPGMMVKNPVMSAKALMKGPTMLGPDGGILTRDAAPSKLPGAKTNHKLEDFRRFAPRERQVMQGPTMLGPDGGVLKGEAVRSELPSDKARRMFGELMQNSGRGRPIAPSAKNWKLPIPTSKKPAFDPAALYSGAAGLSGVYHGTNDILEGNFGQGMADIGAGVAGVLSRKGGNPYLKTIRGLSSTYNLNRNATARPIFDSILEKIKNKNLPEPTLPPSNEPLPFNFA
jgi:hypothetical protein